jgi:hypothetical protein
MSLRTGALFALAAVVLMISMAGGPSPVGGSIDSGDGVSVPAIAAVPGGDLVPSVPPLVETDADQEEGDLEPSDRGALDVWWPGPGELLSPERARTRLPERPPRPVPSV